jgi:hypothetical protein
VAVDYFLDSRIRAASRASISSFGLLVGSSMSALPLFHELPGFRFCGLDTNFIRANP